MRLDFVLAAGECASCELSFLAYGDAPAFSLDEFTLDDLPTDALAGKAQDKQGDNDAMKLLFPEGNERGF